MSFNQEYIIYFLEEYENLFPSGTALQEINSLCHIPSENKIEYSFTTLLSVWSAWVKKFSIVHLNKTNHVTLMPSGTRFGVLTQTSCAVIVPSL